jgi:hypothetical protein
MSKNCKCRERTQQRRCPSVSPLSLAIASQTIFDRPRPNRLNFLPRNSNPVLSIAKLIYLGNTYGNASAYGANSQTVV